MQDHMDLYCAIKNCRWKDAIDLITSGIDPNTRDTQGNLPVYHFIWFRKGVDLLEREFFTFLLQNTDAEVLGYSNHAGETVLQNWLYRALVFNNEICPMVDIEYLRWELIQWTKKCPDLLNQSDDKGNTLLHELIYHLPYQYSNSVKIIKYVQNLIQLLVDQNVPCTKNHLDFTPCDVAKILKYVDIICALGETIYSTPSQYDLKRLKASQKLLRYLQALDIPIVEFSLRLNTTFIQMLFKSAMKPKCTLNYAMQCLVGGPHTSLLQLFSNPKTHLSNISFKKFYSNASLYDMKAEDEQGNTVLHHFVKMLITCYFSKKFKKKSKHNSYSNESSTFDTRSDFFDIMESFSSVLAVVSHLNRKNKLGVTPKATWMRLLVEATCSDSFYDYYEDLTAYALFPKQEKISHQAVDTITGENYFFKLPSELRIHILQYLPPHEMFQNRVVSKRFQSDIESITPYIMKHFFHPFFQEQLLKTSKELQKGLWRFYKAQAIPPFIIDPYYRNSFFRKEYLALGIRKLHAHTLEDFFKESMNLPKAWFKTLYFQSLMCVHSDFVGSGLCALANTTDYNVHALARMNGDTIIKTCVQDESIFLSFLLNDLATRDCKKLLDFEEMRVRSIQQKLQCNGIGTWFKIEPGIGARYMGYCIGKI